MDAAATQKAVRAILDQIAHDLPGIRSESFCTYSDGCGMTVIELHMWRRGGQEAAARISYHVETGDVVRAHYPPLTPLPASIVDLLLDLYNLERRLHEAEQRL